MSSTKISRQVCNEVQWSATSCNNRAKRIGLFYKKICELLLPPITIAFFVKKTSIHKPSYKCPSILNMNSLKNNNKMETKVVSFEQMPELIQSLVERIEALEKTVREKQQPQPLEGELMSVEDVCKMLGKSKSAVYRTVRCHDIPFIRQGNRLYFDRPTIKKWSRRNKISSVSDKWMSLKSLWHPPHGDTRIEDGSTFHHPDKADLLRLFFI